MRNPTGERLHIEIISIDFLGIVQPYVFATSRSDVPPVFVMEVTVLFEVNV